MVRVLAPGKLVLTGAYAVLEGAPAIVAAVDRHAVADGVSVDVRALCDDSGCKLGLGSSAASLVASLGVDAVARGEDLADPVLRAGLFRSARAAHAGQQAGGSGVDVAASVHGGVLRYAIDGADASIRAVDLPADVSLVAFWSGTSARTSELRARVDALRAREPRAAVFSRLYSLAVAAADAIADARGLVDAARDYGDALAALGRAADAPIVLPAFADLAAMAAQEGAAFLPSGAGGGDVGVWLGTAPPSDSFVARVADLSMRRLSLSVDRHGVRLDFSAR